MRILSPNKFKAKKKSNTIVIYGCGYSINTIKEGEFSGFDSIAFNWFCNSNIKTTFYLVREQANIPKRRSGSETPEIFSATMDAPPHKEACKVIKNLMQPHVYPWWNITEVFNGDGVIVRDVKKTGPKQFDLDIFNYGACHGDTTLVDVLHIAHYLKYKRIIFAGVDLYDSRYFWLPWKQPRYTITQKKKKVSDVHAGAKSSIKLIKQYKALYPKVKLLVHNPKSLLASEMPIYA